MTAAAPHVASPEPHAPAASERLRLTPVEKPRGLVARLAYRRMRRLFGRVITPAKVVNARLRRGFLLAYLLASQEEQLSLDAGLRFLVKSYVAYLNDCAFCIDIAHARAAGRGVPVEKFRALPAYHTSPIFSPRERAALAYVEAATRTRRVDDETFGRLRAHFTETQIVEITWLCALEHYYNLINLPLGIGSDNLCAVPYDRS